MSSNSPTLHALLLSAPHARQFVSTALHALYSTAQVHVGEISAARSLITTHRPDHVLIAVAHTISEYERGVISSVMEESRTRAPHAIHFTLVLLSAEHLLLGGELLMTATNNDLHRFDSCCATTLDPHLDLAPLHAQLRSIAHSIEAQRASNCFLPRLTNGQWTESMADPQSYDLWHRQLPRYARYLSDSPVIVGESGTGKTKMAHALHLLSGRTGNFVTITPRDFSNSELIQAELFGSVAGAYTGAVERWGLVRSAQGGTLFIDELQSIDRDLQGKIITFIENKQYRRVGSSESIQADVRLIFATNRSLETLRAEQIIREDFAYRLERVQLHLPPLRERPADVIVGAAYALAKLSQQRPGMMRVKGFTAEAVRTLISQQWPGNLRQLENTIARLCDYAELQEKSIIDATMIRTICSHRENDVSDSHQLQTIIKNATSEIIRATEQAPPETLKEISDLFHTALRYSALKGCEYNIEHAAQILGESVQSLTLFAEGLQELQERQWDQKIQ